MGTDKNYYEEFEIDLALKGGALILAIREKAREWMLKQNSAQSDDLKDEAAKKIARLVEFKKMVLDESAKIEDSESSDSDQAGNEQQDLEQVKLEQQKVKRQKLEEMKAELDKRKLNIDRNPKKSNNSSPPPPLPEKTAQSTLNTNTQTASFKKKKQKALIVSAVTVVIIAVSVIGFVVPSVNQKKLENQKKAELQRQEQQYQEEQERAQYQEQLRRESQQWAQAQERQAAESAAKAGDQREAAQTPQTFTDSRDGQTYRTVKIGTQVWMAQNLNFNANGSRCHNDRADACARFGRLYDWSTALTACPAGWRLPGLNDWQVLVKSAGGDETAGNRLKAKGGGWLKNRDGGIGGTDDYGFSALPAGHYFGPSNDKAEFSGIGIHGTWWTTAHSGNNASVRGMGHSNGIVGRAQNFKSDLVSVRCIRD
ncbi:MAG: hypothetical protein FWE57_08215 [Chitinispirillia bacterium]|nr:hypothetical protein [Chitinispirillia bacterium]